MQESGKGERERITVLFPVFYVCEAVACFRKKTSLPKSGSQSSGRISTAVASYPQPMYIANSNKKDRTCSHEQVRSSKKALVLNGI